MAVEYAETYLVPRVSDPRGEERVRLRAAVLRLGGLLGWKPREVIAFAEAVTDRSWGQCTVADFEAVLEEYQALLRAIHDKAERRAAGKAQAHPEGTEVHCRANRP